MDRGSGGIGGRRAGGARFAQGTIIPLLRTNDIIEVLMMGHCSNGTDARGDVDAGPVSPGAATAPREAVS